MVPIEQIANQSAPSWAETLLKWWKWILLALIVLLAAVVVIVGLAAGWAVALGVAVVAVAAGVAVWNAVKNSIASAMSASALQVSNFTPQVVADVPARSSFQITTPGTPQAAAGSGGTDSAQAAAFRKATSQVFADYQSLPENPAPLPALDLATLQSTILTRIDPVTTIPKRIQGLLTISEHLPWQPADPLEPIMAAPDISAADVRAIARSIAGISFARSRKYSGEQRRPAAIEPGVHRSLHGGAEQRDGPRSSCGSAIRRTNAAATSASSGM